MIPRPDDAPTLVRIATVEDATALAALSIEVWLGTYIRGGVDAVFGGYVLETFTIPRLQALLLDPVRSTFVAADAEGLTGYASLAFGRAAECGDCSDTELATLYVRPGHQGRGVGRSLLAAALGACRARGIARPWLAVNVENARAIAFYRANGFDRSGRILYPIGDRAYPNDILSIDLTTGRA